MENEEALCPSCRGSDREMEMRRTNQAAMAEVHHHHHHHRRGGGGSGRHHPPASTAAATFCRSVLVSALCVNLLFFRAALCFRLDEASNDIVHRSSLSGPAPGSSDGISIFYRSGGSEGSLPICSPNSVCNKVDTYGVPWVEKQCRCPSGSAECSTSISPKDGFTIVDRSRQYKTCEPVKRMKRCKYFRDITWTYISYPEDNSTQQVMHCRCPKNSVAYLIKRQAFTTEKGTGYQYSFACSPQAKLRCQRKEPCKLFSVRKNPERPSADEVSTNSLCQCPHKKKCPRHHLDVGVIPGKVYTEDTVRTYSAYCM